MVFMSDENKVNLNRREFFSFLALGWIAFTAAMGGFLSFIFRFLYPNVNFDPVMEFVAGTPDDFGPGVDERWKNVYGVWILRSEGRIVAISDICTHLGSIPNWLPAEVKFKCPCHGSGYYMSGINFEGPAPRPLERFRISLGDDGLILVDKSKKFQQEKGEWNNPESFLNV